MSRQKREAGLKNLALPGIGRAVLQLLLLVALGLMPVPQATPAQPAAAAPVTLLTMEGAIGPANADYVVRGMQRAAAEGSQLVILRMDTPGGLDTAMRVIIKAILASPVPVASFVAPGGARAASAGTYILYASHIAAMAPGTNLGAATPVQIGGGGDEKPERPGKREGDPDDEKLDGNGAMTRKQVNDAAAYIRGLAQLRGRNGEWAERAVREAVSLPAEEAWKLKVVDYLAHDLPALTAQLDGKTVEAGGREVRLRTAGAPVVDLAPDWRTRVLAAITSPGVALLLMTIGIYGLVFEFMNPGGGVPGVTGAICLLLAMYALQLLPVNYAGLALILLGMGLMVAEAFLPSFGVLGLGGIAAFVTGAVILIDTDVPGFGVPLPLVLSLAVVSALVLAGIAALALQTRRKAVVSGPDELIGAIAEVLEDTPQAGWASLRGETWRVTSHTPLRQGQKVRVLARRGLVLEVAPEGENKTGG